MLYECTYCVFTWYGRLVALVCGKRKYIISGCSSNKAIEGGGLLSPKSKISYMDVSAEPKNMTFFIPIFAELPTHQYVHLTEKYII